MLTAIYIINDAILIYLVLLSFGYVLLLAASIPQLRRRFREVAFCDLTALMKSPAMPPVTVIIPAYNEESSILNAIYSVLRSNYPNTYVMVVNDGSTDATLQLLIETFSLYNITPILANKIKTHGPVRGYYVSKFPIRLTVVNKDNFEKSDALNVGLNACRTPLFITMDADSIMEPDAIHRIVFYMLSRPNTVAVGGGVYILNGCDYKDGQIVKAKISDKFIYALQSCEYMRSFLFSRSGWNIFGGTLCYSGTFTLFDYKAVIDVGGFDVGNFAQDFEIITHLHHYHRRNNLPYNIGYTAAARVWTDVPGTLREFWRQRFHWQFGSLLSLGRHKGMLFNPKYGITGLYTYPFFLFGETFGAIVELTAYCMIFVSWYFGVLNALWAMLFFIICWGFVTFLTMATVMINSVTFRRYSGFRDLMRVLLLVLFENFGYRQGLILSRFYGTISYYWSRIRLYFKPSEQKAT